MNRLTIIGNLTRDPQLRTTQGGVNVCDFTVAVNRRLTAQQRQNGQQAEADFFRVTAWRELGDNCSKYLAKGRKVAVIGPVSVQTYTGNDGVTRASLEVTADEVEFLTPRNEQGAAPAAAPAPAPAGYVPQSPGGYTPAPAAYAPAPQAYAPPQAAYVPQAGYAAPQAAYVPAQAPQSAPAPAPHQMGFTEVETDELPF